MYKTVLILGYLLVQDFFHHPYYADVFITSGWYMEQVSISSQTKSLIRKYLLQCTNVQTKSIPLKVPRSSWWFQSLWKRWSSKWVHLPDKKYWSCHHLVNLFNTGHISTIWLRFVVNVGKYTMTMDRMGNRSLAIRFELQNPIWSGFMFWRIPTHPKRHRRKGDLNRWNVGYNIQNDKLVGCRSHRIHVWYIYLHLPYKSTKCRYIYHTWMVWGCVSLSKDYVRFHVSFLDGGITVYSTDLISLIDKAAWRKTYQN